jgi:hypothetical protein
MREWIDSLDAYEVIASMSIGEIREIEVGGGVWVLEKESNKLIKTTYFEDIIEFWEEKQKEE